MPRRTSTCTVAVAIAFGLVWSGSASAAPSRATASCGAAQTLATLVCHVNAVRAQHGLRRVSGVAILSRSSSIRARTIVRCGDFSHTPCGQSFGAPFSAVGYTRGSYAVGETLAWTSGGGMAPANAVARWMASPPHRRVLLSRGWRELGAAAITAPGLFGQSTATLWVAQFGRRG